MSYIYTNDKYKEGTEFTVQTKTKYEKLPIKTGKYLIVKIVKRTGEETVMCLKEYSSQDYEDNLYLFEATKFNNYVEDGYILTTNQH